MSDDTSQSDSPRTDGSACVENVTPLGTSPAGESFKITRRPQDVDVDDDEDLEYEVLKKLTRSRLRSTDDFRRHFAALRRLEHPNLCAYRQFFPGEEATRITRQWVPGTPLDDYLLRPITDEEERFLENPDDAPSASPTPTDSTTSEASTTDPGPDSDDTPAGLDDAFDDSSTSPDARPLQDTPTDRPSTLEIPNSLIEDSDAADRALDLLILRLQHLLPPLVQGLEFLHRFRQPHGHLSPSNIIVTDDEQVVITDYGLYPQLHISSAHRLRHRSYFPPELSASDGDDDPANAGLAGDLYALGAILFEILAGRPYGATRRTETPDGTGTDPTFSPIFLSEIVPHCPASWVDLIHALLAPDPDDRPSLEEVQTQLDQSEGRSVNIPAAVVDDPDPLYGRRQTLEDLADRSKQCAKERRLAMVLIDGETGVGKTSLVDALARQATQRGWIVCRGRFPHRETGAFQGWDAIIDRMAEITDDLPDSPRQRLAPGRYQASRLFPRLLDDDQSAPGVSKHAAISGLRRWIRGLSDQRPILICLDDLHRAGPDALRLLGDIAERPNQMRVMIVATWPPTENDADHPLWEEIDQAPIPVEAIEVKGFSPSEARTYLETRAPFLDEEQRQTLLQKSDRNPLLVDELLHEWVSRSRDNDGPDDWLEQLPDPDGPEGRRRALRLLLERRLQDLDRPQRLVLQLLVVASGPLDTDLIDRALHQELGTQTADLVSANEVCDDLLSQRLIRPGLHSFRADDASCYTVIHDLCRQIIFDSLGQDHYARLCGILADSLGTDDQPLDDDLRFEYLMLAGRGDEAHRAATLAARAALFRYAHFRSSRIWRWLDERDHLDLDDLPMAVAAFVGARRFDMARDHLTALMRRRPEQRSQWHCQRVLLELRAGRRDAAIDALDTALDNIGVAYASPGLSERTIEPLRRLATITARWADVTELDHYEELSADDAQRAELLHLGLDTTPLLLTTAHKRLATAQGRLAHRQQVPHLLARDRLAMIAPPWLPTLLRQGPKLTRWLQQAHKLATTGDHPRTAIATLEMKALVARHKGDLQGFSDALEQARAHLHEGLADAPLLHTRLDLWTIDHRTLSADLDGARQHLRQCLHRQRHHLWLASLLHLAGADLALLTGKLTAADTHLDAIETFLDGPQDCLLHVSMTHRQTALNIARGRPEVAVAQWDLLLDQVYSSSLQRHPSARWLIHRNLARALNAQLARQLHLQRPAASATRQRLRGVLRRLRDLEDWLGAIELSHLHRLHAHFFLLSDKPTRARRHLDEASAPWDDAPPPLVAILNDAARSAIHRANDDRKKARQLEASIDEQCRDQGYFLPLALHGWSAPSHRTLLQPDADA